MVRPKLKDFIRKSFYAAVPGLAAVGLLTFFQYIEPTIALYTAVAIFAATMVVRWRPFTDMARTKSTLEKFAKNGAAPENSASGELERTAMAAIRATTRRIEILAASAKRAERVIENLPSALILLDQNRVVLKANKAARLLADHDMEGEDIAQSIRHPMLLDAIDAALQDGESNAVDITLPVPVERTYSIHVEPMGIGSDTPATQFALILSFHDLTTVRRGEQMHSDFVANVSHELRTPLTSLAGFIETLRGPAKDDPEAVGNFLKIMQSQTDRMSRLIGDLLSLSRIEMEEHTLPSEEITIISVLQNVRDALQMKAVARKMQIVVDLPGVLPPVRGDRDQLIQVFQNLVDNAIKYGRDNSNVTVSAASEKNTVRITVTNEGEGIPAAAIPRLTERFYRVDPSRSRELGSTGLGLAIVKHIVNRHRGNLAITSIAGEETSFTVILPAMNSDLVAANEADA